MSFSSLNETFSTQRIIIPQGVVDPSETTVIEIPKSLRNVPAVIAKHPSIPEELYGQYHLTTSVGDNQKCYKHRPTAHGPFMPPIYGRSRYYRNRVRLTQAPGDGNDDVTVESDMVLQDKEQNHSKQEALRNRFNALMAQKELDGSRSSYGSYDRDEKGISPGPPGVFYYTEIDGKTMKTVSSVSTAPFNPTNSHTFSEKVIEVDSDRIAPTNQISNVKACTKCVSLDSSTAYKRCERQLQEQPTRDGEVIQPPKTRPNPSPSKRLTKVLDHLDKEELQRIQKDLDEFHKARRRLIIDASTALGK